MYPSRELRALEARREKLRRRMEATRAECAGAVRQVEIGLASVDVWFGRARAWSGLAAAALPLFLRFGKKGKRRRGGPLGRVLRWIPLAWRLYRRIKVTYAGRAG